MLRITREVVAIGILSAGIALPACAQFHRSDKSSAEMGVNTLQAPVPEPITKGKRAFISYEMGDVTAFPSSYSGGPERAYGEFYTQMKAWGRYELVNDPKDADLIFAVRFVDPPAIPHPQIRVGVMSPGGKVSLWGFVEEVNFAFFKKHRDQAFTETVKTLVKDVQDLVGTGAPEMTAQP